MGKAQIAVWEKRRPSIKVNILGSPLAARIDPDRAGSAPSIGPKQNVFVVNDTVIGDIPRPDLLTE